MIYIFLNLKDTLQGIWLALLKVTFCWKLLGFIAHILCKIWRLWCLIALVHYFLKVLKCHYALFHRQKQLIVNIREWNNNVIYIQHYQGKKKHLRIPQRKNRNLRTEHHFRKWLIRNGKCFAQMPQPLQPVPLTDIIYQSLYSIESEWSFRVNSKKLLLIQTGLFSSK